MALLQKFWRSTVYSIMQVRISSAICKGLTVVYLVSLYFLWRPHMIINCENVVLPRCPSNIFRLHFSTDFCLVMFIRMLFLICFMPCWFMFVASHWINQSVGSWNTLTRYFVRPWLRVQEIWANAHETRHSISLISYADCLGLSPVYISAKIHSKCASQPKIAKKSLKTPILGVQGHRGWYPRKARQQWLLW